MLRQKKAAARLAALVEPMFGGTLPIRIRAWDGSEVGPADAPTLDPSDGRQPTNGAGSGDRASSSR